MFTPLFNFLELFRPIPAADREVIGQHLCERRVEEGTVLIQEGERARELFFICKGVLKIVTNTEKGKTVTQFFLKENQFCTILSSFNNQAPAHESVVAACEAELIVFPKDQLMRLYEDLPYFKELLNHIIQQFLLDKIQIRNDYRGADATTRYQQFLLRQPDIALRVSLSDIASYLDITPQSLSRIRKNRQ